MLHSGYNDNILNWVCGCVCVWVNNEAISECVLVGSFKTNVGHKIVIRNVLFSDQNE